MGNGQAREAEAVRELVRWMRAELGLTFADLSRITGASLRTVQRWEGPTNLGAPRPGHADRLAELRDLRRLLRQTFPRQDEGANWMFTGVPDLQGRRPIDLVRRGAMAEVVGVLAGVQSGVFR